MAGLLERDRSRETGRQEQRGPRSYQEAKPKDLYFREDYGWIMSDSDVAYEKDIEGQFVEERKRLTGEKNKAYATYQSKLNEGIGAIRKAYNDQIKSSKAPTLTMPKTISFTAKTKGGPAPGQAHGDNNGSGIGHNNQDSKFVGTYAMPEDMVKRIGEYVPGELVKENGQWVYYTDGVHRKNMLNTFQGQWDKQKGELQKQHNTNMKLYDQAIKNMESERELEVENLKSAGDESWKGQSRQYDEIIKSVDYNDRKKIGQEQFQDRVKSRSDSIINQDAGLLQSPTNIVAKGVKQNAEEQRAERKPQDVQ
ncbi:MAG: hypothetical protein IH612_00130 [Desulfofustis sp.]|nr:hypothetical protein [Desulfofustis sp.]